MKNLLNKIRQCDICAQALKHQPRPVIHISEKSKIIIIGQAPGQKVHQSGIPWDDQSGKELRRWLNVSEKEFYNTDIFGIMPMGFCFPGTGKSGDLPPRKECAPQWHTPVFNHLKDVKLILLIGLYAQKYYLQEKSKSNLTENVARYKDFLPHYFPLVHPSPRNKIWQKKNPWFEEKIVPELQNKVKKVVL